ncbi:hypothetical protein DICVIV_05826 [Dictyocaulus viviparus]|uniref:Uncharacterized protein n=1 Tax=Dictyocaulus viviparus TaxID=29172 RepID=A0A0D8XTW2_DICVI|nr:hypothetical protein DICVIV_05826 [Dictyocaulus viviparus]
MTVHAPDTVAIMKLPMFVRLLNSVFRKLGLLVADHDKLVLMFFSATVAYGDDLLHHLILWRTINVHESV